VSLPDSIARCFTKVQPRYNHSVRKFFRLVLMMLILVFVGIMSALTSMRVAIHGRETTIPNFAKLSVTDAEHLAVRNGLQVAMEGQFYSTDIPEGHVVSQMPPPGTRVRRGWRVRLAQSLGPQRVVIPELIGQSPRAAELNVRQRGLELGTVAEARLRDVASQQIVAQSPPPNASGVQSPKVSVLTASDPEPQAYIMPNFVGRPVTEAASRIDKAGFKLHLAPSFTPAQPNASPTTPPSTVTPGVVTRQTPAAGQKITAETPIELEVSH
jgi:beta-lactam-binding protein with PASTA domain